MVVLYDNLILYYNKHLITCKYGNKTIYYDIIYNNITGY